jgi:hypothetical protein
MTQYIKTGEFKYIKEIIFAAKCRAVRLGKDLTLITSENGRALQP